MNQRFLRYFDWINFIIVVALLTIGLLFILSATYTPENPLSLFFKKQLVGCCIGLIVYFFFSLVDTRIIMRWSLVVYSLIIGLLIYTIFVGLIGMGGRRWISLYFFRAQPSELAKWGFPLFVGEYLDRVTKDIYGKYSSLSLRVFIIPLLVLLVTFVMVARQPDLGTALIILMSGLVMLWCSGLSNRFFLLFFCCLFMGSPLLWAGLRPYQKTRILVLLGYGDNKRERYQAEQSKIAIGSGGLWGKGLLQGTQNRLDFLPEDHSDFIFSIICEEWGFAGALLVILLFGILFTRILIRVYWGVDLSEQVIAVGLVTSIALSVCINIGMVTGMLPIVGIPLPLLSYGLSNLLVTMATFGWLNNITVNRRLTS